MEVARVLLAAVLGLAVGGKVRTFAAFRQYLGTIPGIRRQPKVVAIYVVALEFCGTAALIAGWQVGVAAIGIACICVAGSVVAAREAYLGSGQTCNCFGSAFAARRSPASFDRVSARSAWLFVRNGTVSGVAAGVAAQDFGNNVRASIASVLAVCWLLLSFGLVAGVVRDRRALRVCDKQMRARLAPLLAHLQALEWYAIPAVNASKAPQRR
jgi:uncharacterized membrane protein YphA (DoxX/SURF4 family)